MRRTFRSAASATGDPRRWPDAWQAADRVWFSTARDDGLRLASPAGRRRFITTFCKLHDEDLISIINKVLEEWFATPTDSAAEEEGEALLCHTLDAAIDEQDRRDQAVTDRCDTTAPA